MTEETEEEKRQTTAELGQRLTAQQRHNIITPQLLRVVCESIDNNPQELLLITESFVTGALFHTCESKVQALEMLDNMAKAISERLTNEAFVRIAEKRREYREQNQQ